MDGGSNDLATGLREWAFFHNLPEKSLHNEPVDSPISIDYIRYPLSERIATLPRRSKPRSLSMPDSVYEQIEEEAASTGRSISSVVVGIISTYFRTKIIRRSAWETDDEEGWYSPNHFYTYSQDKFGHSAKIDVTIPKHVAGEIRGIIDSGRIPELRTVQDFLRNAVRHETHRIGKMIEDNELIEAAHTMTISDQIAHEQAVATETQKLIGDISNLLDESIALGHLSYADEKLKDLWKGASAINERFREVYMNTLKDYGEVLRKAQRVERERNRGEQTREDGTRVKNGVELADRKARRKSST